MIVSEKITSKPIQLYQIFIQKTFEFNEKGIISCEKTRISGKYIYIYIYMVMLTRSSERIFNPTRYTGSKRSFSSSGEVQSFDSKVKTVIACTRCLLSFIRKYVMHKWQISVTMILKTLSFFNHLVHWIAYAIICS